MVLFVGSSVNPNGPEIAAAIALWVCGLVLVSHGFREDRQPARHRGRDRGVRAGVEPAARPAVACASSASRSRCSGAGMRCERWHAPAGLGSGSALIGGLQRGARSDGTWSSGLSATRGIRTRQRTCRRRTSTRFTVGSLFDRYKQLIGYLRMARHPRLRRSRYVLWTAGIGFLVSRRAGLGTAAAGRSRSSSSPERRSSCPSARVGGVRRRRRARVAGTLRAALAVGVPIVAAMSIVSSERGRQLAEPRLFVGAGVMLVVAHILAFAQNLRRYTVGADGEIQYWRHAEWSPPLLSPTAGDDRVLAARHRVRRVVLVLGQPAPDEVEERAESRGTSRRR